MKLYVSYQFDIVNTETLTRALTRNCSRNLKKQNVNKWIRTKLGIYYSTWETFKILYCCYLLMCCCPFNYNLHLINHIHFCVVKYSVIGVCIVFYVYVFVKPDKVLFFRKS